jgi:hypothetical protein
MESKRGKNMQKGKNSGIKGASGVNICKWQKVGNSSFRGGKVWFEPEYVDSCVSCFVL